jgi:hypothetical protein
MSSRTHSAYAFSHMVGLSLIAAASLLAVLALFLHLLPLQASPVSATIDSASLYTTPSTQVDHFNLPLIGFSLLLLSFPVTLGPRMAQKLVQDMEVL